MKNKIVKVFAPATIANVGPGFDVLGLALEKPGDIIIAKREPEKGLRFSLGELSVPVPTDHHNVAAHVANLMLEEINPPFGVSMILQKLMPIGSGLGSSGASSAAAAIAINSLLPKPLPTIDLVRFAAAGEKLASGSLHADNVAPALLGGLCLIRSYHPLDIVQIPVKNSLFWVVLHPHLIIETQMARDLLPKILSLTTLVEQSGNLSGFIAGLILGDNALVKRSLQDCIAEPIRATLIPQFYEAKQAAIAAGALGFSLSGSGPSVFAIATSLPKAKKIADAIQAVFFSKKIRCDRYISRLNTKGATILEQST